MSVRWPIVESVSPTLGEPTIPSPLARRGLAPFVSDAARVRLSAETPPLLHDGAELLFEKAGPRERLFFNPAQTRAAIVTCGGLCPGLNAVIRSAWLELTNNYGVAEVLGIRDGYRGLNPNIGPDPVSMTDRFVSTIHHLGGTILGSSRGNQEIGVMVDSLERWRIDLLFCLGGDGTLRGAHEIARECQRRGQSRAIIGIPKTIDNDIMFCDRSFGLITAVEGATEAVHAAHVEACGAPRGIGLVKVMGRNAGYIACGAGLASQEANFVLIPEVSFALGGPNGFFATLERRMDVRGHAVIVVAEGAGQDLFQTGDDAFDASGNRKLRDIGPFLRDAIVSHFRQVGKPVELKYIDPSYLIRSAPPNTDDRLLCDQLARHAVHAAMAGKTDMVVTLKNNRFMHVPIAQAVATRQAVNPAGPLWSAVLAATGQPACMD